MLRMTVPVFLAATASAVLAAHAQAAETGKRERCVQLHMVQESVVIDDKTILLRMRGKAGDKRVDLVNSCSGLKMADGFGHETSTNNLCDLDTIRPLQSGSSSCGIDKIVTIDERETKALLASR